MKTAIKISLYVLFIIGSILSGGLLFYIWVLYHIMSGNDFMFY